MQREGNGIPKNRVRVHTRIYEFAHGRKPRGTGGWIFCNSPYPDRVYSPTFLQFIGTYTHAKQMAVAEAARRQLPDLWLCS